MVDAKGKPLLELERSNRMEESRQNSATIDTPAADTAIARAGGSNSSTISLRGSLSSIANVTAQSTGVAALARKSLTPGSRSGQVKEWAQWQAGEEKENTPTFVVERRASVATALQSL